MSNPQHDDVVPYPDEDLTKQRDGREAWIVLFMRKLLHPILFGRSETAISDREFRENEALEETPEEEVQNLERERKAAELSKHNEEKHPDDL
ncbi:hypothetical protein A3H16_00465 [Candidatus Kaiserbacteria bacterium RIFCSPLOWO2_12_FULL_53_8]|uniref:Uncharacterized protein n=2 Tax=Candidatus Kaiseribacteriota TaxID=1752734 RepID=A0A1F6CXM2_9BACT|nr:MAG: hypothetical protein A2851_03395 [Candidatus Kaiserbacteria bacterium RIFCSPHIGHO2_01_FULL_53_29]OGG92117.1 MAG: hypothetical protein A3H16_00465 [Candidatus Kaiserbacteria bacterium RIFCSPLOWO2_12_FULL_53_8]